MTIISKRKLRSFNIALGLCLAIGMGSGAFAQVAESDGVKPAAATGERRALEEVIVTAQKQAQSSQDVPISISAFSGDFMKQIGANNLQDVAAYIPNLKFSSDTDPALAQINIRGFGTNPLNAAFENSVGFVQDEVFYGRPGYFSEAVFDIARVEVLRGPQGTLFGKNTVAGVFNVSSAGPTESFAGDIRISRSDTDEERIEVGVGGPLGERAGWRLAALSYDKPGEIENSFPGDDESLDRFDQLAERATLHWNPIDPLSLQFSATRSDTESRYWPLQLHLMDEDTRNFLDDYDPAVEDDPYNFQLSHNVPGFLDKGSESYSLKADWELGDLWGGQDWVATAVVADSELYIRSVVDLDASPADLAVLQVNSDYQQQSVELRLAGGWDGGIFGIGQSVDVVLGGFWFESRFSQATRISAGEHLSAFLLTDDAQQLLSGDPSAGLGLNTLPLAGPGLSALLGGLLSSVIGPVIGDDAVLLDYLLDVESMAWFAQMTWQLSEHWALTPGIRFSRETKTADAAGSSQCSWVGTGLPCVMELALSAEPYDEKGLRREESDVSPKLSLQYFPSDALTLFLTYAKGFKSGGFNGSSFTGDDLNFEPEQADTLELGAKGRFFEDTLELNLTLFRTELQDLQVLAFNGAFFDVTNAATAVSEGIEFDFRWLTPLAWLELAGSAGILDANYESYPSAPAPINSGVDATQDLSGEPVALAPKASASLSPTISLPLPWGLGFQARADMLYQGEQYSDTDLDPVTFIPENTTVSARLSVGAQDQAWSLSLGGSNLTDEKIANQILDTVFFPGTYNSSQKAGRKLYLALSMSW